MNSSKGYYEEKYLKYKNKYLLLKKITQIDQKFKSSLNLEGGSRFGGSSSNSWICDRCKNITNTNPCRCGYNLPTSGDGPGVVTTTSTNPFLSSASATAPAPKTIVLSSANILGRSDSGLHVELARTDTVPIYKTIAANDSFILGSDGTIIASASTAIINSLISTAKIDIVIKLKIADIVYSYRKVLSPGFYSDLMRTLDQDLNIDNALFEFFCKTTSAIQLFALQAIFATNPFNGGCIAQSLSRDDSRLIVMDGANVIGALANFLGVDFHRNSKLLAATLFNNIYQAYPKNIVYALVMNQVTFNNTFADGTNAFTKLGFKSCTAFWINTRSEGHLVIFVVQDLIQGETEFDDVMGISITQMVSQMFPKCKTTYITNDLDRRKGRNNWSATYLYALLNQKLTDKKSGPSIERESSDEFIRGSGITGLSSSSVFTGNNYKVGHPLMDEMFNSRLSGSIDDKIRLLEADPANFFTFRTGPIMSIASFKKDDQFDLLHADRSRGYWPLIPLCYLKKSHCESHGCPCAGFEYEGEELANDQENCTRCNHGVLYHYPDALRFNDEEIGFCEEESTGGSSDRAYTGGGSNSSSGGGRP